MQIQNRTQILFLEEWLKSATAAAAATATATAAVNPYPLPSSARAILQAWAELRDSSTASDHRRLHAALQTLSASASSLHLSDPQATLLISLLSSAQTLTLTPHHHRLILHLLYLYLRRSTRPSPDLLSSLLPLLSPPSPSPPHSLLLLGALSAAPSLPAASRSAALRLFLRILDGERPALRLFPPELVPEALAGVGYALSCSDATHSTGILKSLFKIWGSSDLHPTLAHGLMLLRLLEWCVSGFVSQRSPDRVNAFCSAIEEFESESRFAILMASAGVLRGLRVTRSTEFYPRMKNSMEGSIASVARHAISVNDGSERRLLLQCVSLALARCGSIQSNDSVLLCLCFALTDEIFPLPSLFQRSLECPNVDSSDFGLSEVREHLASVLFKESGAVTGVLCNQYEFANEESKLVVENHMWGYSQSLYWGLRVIALLHWGKRDELVGAMEKIAEAAFLMVVIFSAYVSKHRLNPKSYRKVLPDASVKILSALSCVEYLRRIRLPEYTDAVRRAVLTIQEDATLCASFIESMPPYVELTNEEGSFAMEGRMYLWYEDEVQTARVLFYLRVIPTCISLIPASLFAELVAPTMFLYMQHPNEKVARASHSVFVAFMSSGKNSEEDERSDLKEQLVFYYMERSLEAYPGVTPFEGLASGVAAVVRYLRPGSPAICYCIHSLIEKESDLCQRGMNQDANIWKNWEENSDACKKVLDLLLRLISLVDIQVFPLLLKQLAEFIVRLPKDGQNAVLNEMYAQVAESDDVTRKPVLVSWLQSLSYLLCSRSDPITANSVHVETGTATDSSLQGLSLNTTSSRL